MIKLSIIVPVYNGEKYIKDCIESINSSINDTVEIIIINDGSTDNTINILKTLNNKHIKIYNTENRGVSYSRNYGLSKVQGEWIMFVDADDLLSENWFTKIQNYLNSDNKEILYFGNGYSNDYSKNEIILNILGIKNDLKYLSGPFSKIFKRKLIVDNDIVFEKDIINGEDMLFNLECLLVSKNISFYDYSFYKYRNNISSATHIFKEKIYDSDTKFQKCLKRIFSKRKVDNELANYCIDYCMSNAIFTIAQRVSIIDNNKERNKNYKKTLLMYKYKISLLSYKRRIIVMLLKLHCYNIVTRIYKRKADKKILEEFELI